MIYGICNLSIIPVRILNCDKSEMINQLIYGDVFEVLEEKEKWIKIKSMYDDYTGWIDNKQYFKVDDTNKLILNKPRQEDEDEARFSSFNSLITSSM